ncbi:hypothetical protein EAG_11662 [Camponotus floridanus]|uniref:Uncharacterized protein n=1 Tax=Camponotus floridanus TaxID=104421 RepID=E2AAD0_CAMFO|nr:hypothetical protein EAG_11662 [Camponotus floridanus]
MCPVVGYSVNDKSPLADLDTLLSTPAGPGLSHVRMALARRDFERLREAFEESSVRLDESATEEGQRPVVPSTRIAAKYHDGH